MTDPTERMIAEIVYRASVYDDVSDAGIAAMWAATEHRVSCTREPFTCLKCDAEWALKCARKIMAVIRRDLAAAPARAQDARPEEES